MKDQQVINAFITHLQKEGYPGLKIDRWPDIENRETSDIDAIAGRFAIEHTSIDTIPNQRQDSDWFMQIISGIEEELSGSLPFRLKITIEYDAVKKGQDWASIRQNLKDWIINESASLNDGLRVFKNIEGIPFSLHVRKASDWQPVIRFARYSPEDDSLPKRIRTQLDRKAQKLAKYHKSGSTTVLLLENDDIALMDDVKMLDSIKKAYPDGLPNNVDKLWYADTSILNDIRFIDCTVAPWKPNFLND